MHIRSNYSHLLAYLIYAIGLVGAARAGDPALDPGGWTAAKWGMTPDQVLAAIPDAHPLATPESERTLFGIACPIGIDSVTIGTSDVAVLFSFAGGKLSAVYLRPRVASEDEYINYARLLVEKYGRPFDRTAGRNRIAEWAFPATIITLRYSVIAPAHIEAMLLTYTQPAPTRL